MLELVPCTPDTKGTHVTASKDISHRCPYRDETDHGTAHITWQVDDCTIELHNLAEYLDSLATIEASHEDITAMIGNHLRKSGIDVVRVETVWHTAGMDIHVTKGGA